MTERNRVEIKKIEGLHCFACGTENPIGLNLHFYYADEAVCSDITLSRNHVGWENMAHGGIISALLDEVMSWTVLYFKRTFLVTRKMETSYLRPVQIGEPLTVKGRIAGNSGRSNTTVAAKIYDTRGKVLAKSKGEFVLLSKEKLSLVPDSAKEKIEKLFRDFHAQQLALKERR